MAILFYFMQSAEALEQYAQELNGLFIFAGQLN